MTRLLGKLLVLFIIFAFMIGCWSRRELNDLAITVAIGLDKIGNRYQVSTQIVNPNEVAAKKGSSSKGAPVFTYKETADTVFEALRKMTTKSPRKLYFSHLRAVVISEQLAKEGISKPLDLLSRDHEFRTDFFIMVAKGISAEKVLDIYTVPQEIIPANKIYKSIENTSQVWGASSKSTIDRIIADMAAEGKQPAVAGVTVDNNVPDEIAGTVENVRRINPITKLIFSNMAVFKKDRLIGWLTEDESKAYNYITGGIKSTVNHVDCPGGGKVTLELMRAHSAVRGTVVNGNPEATVHVQLEENVADSECRIDLNKEETFKGLEERAEKKIGALLTRTILKMQKYRSDIFGFGEAIHRSAPGEWGKLKHVWDQRFQDLPVKVKVDVKILNKGTVSESLQEIVKE